jgi:two-component system chemotaxis response regulator CheB
MSMLTSSAGPVKVLVVDDSLLMQKLMTQIIDSAPGFKVIGVAGSAEEGWDAIQELRPDILTLDLELPGRHGLKLLARVLKQDPLPVLIVSAFGGPGADNTIQALELGAIDFIEKPDGTTHTLEGFMKHLVAALSRASASRRMFAARREDAPARPAAGARAFARRADLADRDRRLDRRRAGRAGGDARPRASAHPDRRGAAYAAGLHREIRGAAGGRDRARCPRGRGRRPAEARHGGGRAGRAAPSRDRGAPGRARLRPAGRAAGQRPQPFGRRDVPFRGAQPRPHAVGILLTGMGRDGADGLLAMRKAGAETLIQSGETCVVNGMPKAAFEIGAADRVVPLDQIGAAVGNLIGERPHLRTA